MATKKDQKRAVSLLDELKRIFTGDSTAKRASSTAKAKKPAKRKSPPAKKAKAKRKSTRKTSAR